MALQPADFGARLGVVAVCAEGVAVGSEEGSYSLAGLGCCPTGFPDLRRLILESVGKVGEVCMVLAVGNAYWSTRIVGTPGFGWPSGSPIGLVVVWLPTSKGHLRKV